MRQLRTLLQEQRERDALPENNQADHAPSDAQAGPSFTPDQQQLVDQFLDTLWSVEPERARQ